ncbi:MAG: tyrosine-type recombinase/integrase [Dehalococcoidia bacterium]
MVAERVVPTESDESVSGWDRALYAFLAEKERRSGSGRTVQAYASMLHHFFGATGKPPDRIASADVFAWAYGVGASGKQPSATTIGARVACLSSFYRFLIRLGATTSNPCDALERPRKDQAVPRGLSADNVRQFLAAIPDTPAGLRDRAIVLTLVLTGRRRTEVLSLTRGDLIEDDRRIYYAYKGKGGKRGKRELPAPAYEATVAALAALGKDMATMAPDEPLWQAHADGKALTSGTFYARLQRYFVAAGLPRAGVHIFRHSAAKLRRDAGESVEDVSRFLDHSSLAVTTTYLRRLEGEADTGWAKVAEAIGIKRGSPSDEE